MDKGDIRTIEEIAVEIYIGNGVTKAQLGTGNYPAVKCGDVNSELPMHFYECISFVDNSLIDKPKYFEHRDILVGALAHNIKNIGKVKVYLGNHKCLAGNDIIVLRTNQNQKYLAYMLSSRFCRKQIEQEAIASSVVHLYTKDLKKIQVPLPPLETQERIVQTLEKLDNQIKQLEKDIQELTITRQNQCKFLTTQVIN